MSTQTGLRERKKQQTRLRISAAALDLFDQRGFDRVPVAEIAHAAEVSEATLFNYFPTKEDLVYGGMEAYEQQLLDAVRHRPAGTSVVAAIRDHVLEPRGALASDDPALIARVAQAARIIAGSTALQTREQQIIDRATNALAEIIAEETSSRAHDIKPWFLANALMGVNRAITRTAHQYAQQGRSGPSIARTVLSQARQAFDVLEQGLAATARDDRPAFRRREQARR
jgi:AcrR family transcriptional regulator